jgi:hypothetical protein
MASSKVARLAGAMAVAAVLVTLAVVVPVAVQRAAPSDQKVTICQATGSTANPWVFTTIEARDLPDHLARGDYRATAIADCSAAQAAAAATPATSAAGSATPASGPAVPLQGGESGAPLSSAAVAQGVGTPTTTPPGGATAAPPTAVATAVPASATAAPTLSVAGAQATPEPEVSALPRSGDEPDRVLLVLLLLGLIGAGLGLRRLGRTSA